MKAEFYSSEEALCRMAARIAEILEDARQKPSPRWLRAEVPLADCAPLMWLCEQRSYSRYYWCDRAQSFEMAGVGEAEVLVPSGPSKMETLFAYMRNTLSSRHPALRYYGGFRFHTGAVKGKYWNKFREYRFVLPRFEVCKNASGVTLACNIRRGHPDANTRLKTQLLEELATLRFPSHPALMPEIKVESREDHPDRLGWTPLLEKAFAAFDADALKKVVLARESVFTMVETLDPVALLTRLTRQTMRSYDFCFQPAPDRAFIGASPERLFRRNNCHLSSEALAGTRPRGRTDAEDSALADELLQDEKERREHQFVVDRLCQHFSSFCRHTADIASPHLMRLRNCQHLHTPIEGLLNDEYDPWEIDAQLIRALHPTPAVGGSPRTEALRFIAEEEPFDRGIYAAPVGWVGYDSAEFCVAIRSGLVQGNELILYSGAGIVPGSTPQAEWDEIETKMANFLAILKA